MSHGELVIKKQIADISYTAEDYQLFDDMPGVNEVSKLLNMTIMQGFNDGLSRSDLNHVVWNVQSHNSNFGAADTEPNWFISDILDKLYGSD